MKNPARILVTLALLAGGATACSLVVGSLDECKVDADCASKGANLVCQDKLCVAGHAAVDAGTDAGPAVLRDPLCQSLFGAVDGGPNLVRFGAIVPKTTSAGTADQRGVLREHAIQLAAEQVNAKSALPNHALVIRVCDDTGDATKAAAEAKELLDEGAVALVTTGSSQTIAVADPAIPAGATLMSISATSTQIASAGVLPDGGAKRVWSTAASDALQGKVLAQLLTGQLASSPAGAPFASVSCVQRDDIAFNGLFDSVQATLSSIDGGPAINRHIYAAGSDPTGAVQAAMADNPGAVLVITTVGETPKIFAAWTQPDPVWLFTDNARSTSLYAFDGGLQRLAGSEGTGPSAAPTSDPVYGLFKGLYTAEFSVDPATSSYVPNAYDAVLLLAAGALWADGHGGVSGPGIASGLGQLSDTTQAPTNLTADNFTALSAAFSQGKRVNVRGASGALDFDPATGVAPGPIDVWALQPDGGIGTLQSVTP